MVTASAAGALSAQLLRSRRGKLTRERVYPAEKDVTKEEAKVGVFVCRCGANIGRVVDVPSVVEYSPHAGQCRSCRGEPVRLRDEYRPGDLRHDPRQGAQSGRGRRVHPEDA